MAEIVHDPLARAGVHIRRHLPRGGRVFLVTTPPVRARWAAVVERSLADAGLACATLAMPDGEAHKTLPELGALADALVAAGADRDALVVALGGGMVGDVAAFLASIYMRGVALVQIPTTLVAMIDSSLGGKTAVNLPSGKNLLGTFHHPRAILVDPEVLRTLPPREFRSGMAEAVKYGIIGDPALFEFIEAHADAIARLEPEPLGHLVATCLAQKAAVVAADEREADLRRILNFGHTLGHALESATAYTRYLHGEAVAWGMIAANEIAVETGRLARPEADRMRALVLRVCAPLPPVTTPCDELLRHASTDKKARAGVLHFVLARSIGRVEIAHDVDAAAIRAAWERVLGLRMS